MTDPRPSLPVIAGPTASRKTGLAVELALRLNGEVVSADSMQVYDTLQIGTARPRPEELRGYPTICLASCRCPEGYSVARYAEDARRAIADIRGGESSPALRRDGTVYRRGGGQPSFAGGGETRPAGRN